MESAVARLFIIISLGYLLGEVRFPGNFRLGVAAVLFVGSIWPKTPVFWSGVKK
ncbi:MAG: hypothetical protein AAB676_20590 [Verrucomicrobiota bacterium]